VRRQVRSRAHPRGAAWGRSVSYALGCNRPIDASSSSGHEFALALKTQELFMVR
jgi:hypothetical protein